MAENWRVSAWMTDSVQLTRRAGMRGVFPCHWVTHCSAQIWGYIRARGARTARSLATGERETTAGPTGLSVVGLVLMDQER